MLNSVGKRVSSLHLYPKGHFIAHCGNEGEVVRYCSRGNKLSTSVRMPPLLSQGFPSNRLSIHSSHMYYLVASKLATGCIPLPTRNSISLS